MTHKRVVNVGTIGHVDHGKSTLREALGLRAYSSALEDSSERLYISSGMGFSTPVWTEEQRAELDAVIAKMHTDNLFGKGK